MDMRADPTDRPLLIDGLNVSRPCREVFEALSRARASTRSACASSQLTDNTANAVASGCYKTRDRTASPTSGAT